MDRDKIEKRAEPVDLNADREIEEGDPANERRWARSRALGENLWHATLGTTVSVRRRARKHYRRLVNRGARYQRLRAHFTRSDRGGADAPPPQAEPAPRVSAVERLHNFEHNLEDRLDRSRDNTLHWIGVPSRKDFEALEQKVEILNQELQALRKLALAGDKRREKPAGGQQAASA